MPSQFTKTVGAPRTRGSGDPSVAAPCRSSRLVPSQLAIVAQEKTPANAQPKCQGCLPKPGKHLSSLSFLFFTDLCSCSKCQWFLETQSSLTRTVLVSPLPLFSYQSTFLKCF